MIAFVLAVASLFAGYAKPTGQIHAKPTGQVNSNPLYK